MNAAILHRQSDELSRVAVIARIARKECTSVRMVRASRNDSARPRACSKEHASNRLNCSLKGACPRLLYFPHASNQPAEAVSVKMMS
jgi:hypothetical protein